MPSAHQDTQGKFITVFAYCNYWQKAAFKQPHSDQHLAKDDKEGH